MTHQIPKGRLIIIGGHENKDGGERILREVAAAVGNAKLVIIPMATSEPKQAERQYEKLFRELGVGQVETLQLDTIEDARSERALRQLDNVSVVFFTGGDQVRIASQLGKTPVYDRLVEIYYGGGVIVGTSAGAAVMPETMLISGHGDESHRVSALDLGPGLGLMQGTVIDTHFAERGRIGRLLGVVALNPRILGIGIDEDTAIITQDGHWFKVLGSGAVYVVDGSEINYSSLSEDKPEGVVSIHNVKLHILTEADEFDVPRRQPRGKPKSEDAKEESKEGAEREAEKA